MTATNRTCDGSRAGDAWSDATMVRDREHGFGAAIAMAFRPAACNLPDDMRRLLARLD